MKTTSELSQNPYFTQEQSSKVIYKTLAPIDKGRLDKIINGHHLMCCF